MLPQKLPKKAKRDGRWRSPAHCNFVRSHACSNCGGTAGIEVAHVRVGSGAGMGQKPDDWWAVSLCRDCHAEQHRVGEVTFWQAYREKHNWRHDVYALMLEFAAASPKAAEIKRVRAERRANG